MKNLLKFSNLSTSDVERIFHIADELEQGGYKDCLKDKSVIMFFPSSSIRTRVTFERGVSLLGGQSILFPTETLDKKEALKDVCGYLNNWDSLIIARHKRIHVLEELTEYSHVPVINAMTDSNHPCEILSDLYALSKMRKNIDKKRFLFCGKKGNIGLTWLDAARVLGFDLAQCCPKGYEMADIQVFDNIEDAVAGRDIICTDSLSDSDLEAFSGLQITRAVMNLANEGALLNPCPPFYRGEEVSEDVIASDCFVGYEFKKSLLVVQQAIMIDCINKF